MRSCIEHKETTFVGFVLRCKTFRSSCNRLEARLVSVSEHLRATTREFLQVLVKAILNLRSVIFEKESLWPQAWNFLQVRSSDMKTKDLHNRYKVFHLGGQTLRYPYLFELSSYLHLNRMWLELSQFKIKFSSPGETGKKAFHTGFSIERCFLSLVVNVSFNDASSMKITKKILMTFFSYWKKIYNMTLKKANNFVTFISFHNFSLYVTFLIRKAI